MIKYLSQFYFPRDIFAVQLQQSIQRLEAERDYFRKEYINCRDEQYTTSDKDNVRIRSCSRELLDSTLGEIYSFIIY